MAMGWLYEESKDESVKERTLDWLEFSTSDKDSIFSSIAKRYHMALCPDDTLPT
jgi:hypothetical protein